MKRMCFSCRLFCFFFNCILFDHYALSVKSHNCNYIFSLPHINSVLLAPTTTIDPTVPVEEKAEPATREVEIQTIYRESEAQTMPYTPDYNVPPGTLPEVLLLKDLHYENGGLSIGHVLHFI